MSELKFRTDLKRFSQLVEKDVGTVRRRVAKALYEKTSRRTPVDTGRLRASWALSDGTPSNYTAPVGASGLGPVTATFSNPFEASYLVNNLPYVLPIEFGGHSRKAPAGMVRISIAEVDAELKSVLERLR